MRCVHKDPEPVRLSSAAAVVRHEVDVGKIVADGVISRDPTVINLSEKDDPSNV